MSLSTDRRGRVPFALVGVLLLVSASVYATGLADRTAPAVDRGVTESLDATGRDVRPALRAAVQDAARDAARNPVTEPADTPTGQVLNDSSPFVDSLRVRIAVGARRALDGAGRETASGWTTVSLPPIDDAADLRAAKRAVRLRRVDGGTAMKVTIRNISVRAHREGRVVARRRLNLTLTVRTPVLVLHDQATRYEQRLNRGPLEGPGLGRGVTARLYPVTTARALARYGGAPIENVLGNRHVALSTNAALLAQQRAVFGRHDPAAARALEVATVRVGVTDVLRPRNGDAAAFAAAVLRPNAVDDAERASERFEPEMPDAPPIAASPEAAADEAYLGASDDLAGETAGSYQVTGRLHTRVVERHRGTEPAPDPPGENWTLLSERTSDRTVVTAPKAGTTDSARNGSSGGEMHRRVTVQHTTTRVWVRGTETRETSVSWRDEYHVAVAVAVAYTPDDAAPDRPTAPTFNRGGALDGPNLAGSRERVTRELLAANGGVDAVAVRVARAASGGPARLTRNVTVTARRPDALEPWVAADLRAFRQRVANVTVTLPRQRVAAGAANAPARLAERLRDRRAALIDAPGEYDGVADRARVAVRAAYLDRVIAALERRAAKSEERNAAYAEEVMAGSARRLASVVSVGTDGASRPNEPQRTDGRDALRVVPDASPAYLTLEAVEHEHVPTVPPNETVHPLAVESTNWFAVPYGEAASEITGAVFDQKRVTLETAAGTLVAANRTLDAPQAGTDDADGHQRSQLRANRNELTDAVARSVARLERVSCAAASRERGVSRQVCRGVIDDLRRRWAGVGRRGLAMTNGSYADAFAAALERRGVRPSTATDAAIRVRVRLRDATANRHVSVPEETTNRTAAGVRAYAEKRTRKAVEGALANGSRKAARKVTGASRLPAGLPLAPPPYTWVATVNAWSVTVRGEYQRFALRAPSGSPDGGGAVVRYVRDGSTAALDVDGDGTPETLGWSGRVSFETGTTVVAAVPPGPPGVGDVDGTRTERSAGWPCPGSAEGSRTEREDGCTARDAE